MTEHVFRSQVYDLGLPDGVPARLLQESMAEEAALVSRELTDYTTALDVPVAEISDYPQFNDWLPEFLVQGDFDAKQMDNSRVMIIRANVVPE